jgi:hypothetical protein
MAGAKIKVQGEPVAVYFGIGGMRRLISREFIEETQKTGMYPPFDRLIEIVQEGLNSSEYAKEKGKKFTEEEVEKIIDGDYAGVEAVYSYFEEKSKQYLSMFNRTEEGDKKK